MEQGTLLRAGALGELKDGEHAPGPVAGADEVDGAARRRVECGVVEHGGRHLGRKVSRHSVEAALPAHARPLIGHLVELEDDEELDELELLCELELDDDVDDELELLCELDELDEFEAVPS